MNKAELQCLSCLWASVHIYFALNTVEKKLLLGLIKLTTNIDIV